jgi:hypothetical protein
MAKATLSRRKFIGASAGVAAAASLGGATAALGRRDKIAKETVPPHVLGVQHFSVRDATARLGIASRTRRGEAQLMGFLGGDTYPDDPTDLGPLVPLPGGYAEVFEFLASCGIQGFEFFQSTQSANEFDPPRQPTFPEIRSYLDNAGMYAMGTHQFGVGNLDVATGNLTANGEILFNNLATLGMKTMGFSGNLSNLATIENQVNPVTGAVTFGFGARTQHVTRIGEILASRGVQYFYHPEQDNYRFFADPAHPEYNETHRIEYVLANADRELFKLELDYLHNYSGRARFRLPDPTDPTNREKGIMDISIWRMIQDDPKRLMGYHLKDGNANPAWRVGDPITGSGETGGSPYLQTFLRTPTFTDTLVPLEGDLGKGFPAGFDPDNKGMKKFMSNTRGGFNRFVIIESDSGPGPTTGANADPGRSLRHAKASAKFLLALRG